MISYTFNHRDGSAVAHTEALSSHPCGIEKSASRTVHDSIAYNDVLVGLKLRADARADDDLAPTHSLTHVVVGLPVEIEPQTADAEGTKALARGALKVAPDRSGRQARIPVSASKLACDARSDCSVDVANFIEELHRASSIQRLLGILKNRCIQGPFLPVISLPSVKPRPGPGGVHRIENRAQVQFQRLGRVLHRPLLQEVHPADDLFQLSESKLGQDAAHILGQEGEEINHHLRSTGELRAKLRLLRGYTHRTRIQMALAGHDATDSNHRSAAKAILLRTKHRSNDDVPSSFESTVGPQNYPLAKIVHEQHLLGLGKP